MPRFIVELPMLFRCHITADHSAAAVDQARRVMMNVDHGRAIKAVIPPGPQATHAQVVYTSAEPKVDLVAVQDVNGITDPEKRLRAIYERCFQHSGPRLPFDDVTAIIARAAYELIPEGPSKLRAHAAFDDYGVDIGVAICTPAIFTGEWFGYDRNTYDLGIRGFDNGARWNGWACPLFDLKGMKAIVEWQDQQDKESMAGMDRVVISTSHYGDIEVAMQFCADNGGELVHMSPETYQTTQGPKKLYAIGDGWCWEAFTKDYPTFKVLVG